jgi:hypothetical protein
VLHQLQVGRVVGGLEQPSTAADDDRVDVEPVLVDQVQPVEGLDQVDPAEPPARREALGPTSCSVRRKTIFGTDRQMPANSRMVGG